MIEVQIIQYLTATTGVNAYAEEPEKKDRPDRYFRVEKTGSGVRNGLQNATVAIQSYAPTMQGAMELNYVAIKALTAMPDDVVNVTACRKVSDYNYTDTGTHRYRYQAVFSVYFFDKE